MQSLQRDVCLSSGQFSMLQVLSTEERYQTAVLMRASKQQQAGAVNQGRYVAK